MNWFGKDWGAPVCKTTPRMMTPVGQQCHRCGEKIRKGDRGVFIPGSYLWHIDCFVECVSTWRPHK